MKRPRNPRYSTVTQRTRHTTVGPRPPKRSKPGPAPKSRVVPRLEMAVPKTRPPAKRQVGRLVDEDESTLIDVLDNLLSKGVVLNAEVILALANVDLIYLRLSAILCGAARVMPAASR